MRALVLTSTTADDRKTIAAVRALGKEGIHVTLGADRRWVPPQWSRFCRDTITYPDPSVNMQRFVDHLLDCVQTSHFDVLLPLCDYTTAGLAAHQEHFRKSAALAVPQASTRARAQDKLEVSTIAQRLGMLVPETYSINSKAGAAELVERLDFPCVVKFRKGAGAVGLQFPNSAPELLACFEKPWLSERRSIRQHPVARPRIYSRRDT